jgi:hypothetical protein
MTVADLKKMLETMPEDSKIVIQFDNSDVDWTVTYSGTLAEASDETTSFLYCGSWEDPEDEKDS